MSKRKKGKAIVQERCHNGPVCIGTIDKAEIWAGDWLDVLPVRQWALVISLSANVAASHFIAPVTGNSVAQRLLPKSLFRARPVAHMSIDWPDGDVPPLGQDFWQELLTALRTVTGRVVIHCQGGHGRTGTAVAILFALADVIPKRRCPIAWLRSKYCHEAVESDAQADYIEHITGRKVTSEPSWYFMPLYSRAGGVYVEGSSIQSRHPHDPGRLDPWDKSTPY